MALTAGLEVTIEVLQQIILFWIGNKTIAGDGCCKTCGRCCKRHVVQHSRPMRRCCLCCMGRINAVWYVPYSTQGGFDWTKYQTNYHDYFIKLSTAYIKLRMRQGVIFLILRWLMRWHSNNTVNRSTKFYHQSNKPWGGPLGLTCVPLLCQCPVSTTHIYHPICFASHPVWCFESGWYCSRSLMVEKEKLSLSENP